MMRSVINAGGCAVRRKLGVLIVPLLSLILAGCYSAPVLGGTPQAVAKLETFFPVIERLHVAGYWIDNSHSCRYISYRRGIFSTDTSIEGCWIWDLGEPQSFDDQARADMAEVEAAIDATNLPLDYFSVEFGADGSVTAESNFSLDRGCGDVYTYHPRWTSLPTENAIPGKSAVGMITPNWYETSIACYGV